MAARAADIDTKRLLEADKHPADWLTYHGSYKSWHYSGLDQINTNNIKNLKVAWTHATPHSTRGLRNMALAVATARRGWATAADVVNTRPVESVLRRVG